MPSKRSTPHNIPSLPLVTKLAPSKLDGYPPNSLRSGISCVAVLADSSFPGSTWSVPQPEAVGWSPARLAQAKAYWEALPPTSICVVANGVLVAAWGEHDRKRLIRSIRKSLLNSVVGIHVADGAIDINATLHDFSIDDERPALTMKEKRATVRDLLMSRSGVYHPAESEDLTVSRPGFSGDRRAW